MKRNKNANTKNDHKYNYSAVTIMMLVQSVLALVVSITGVLNESVYSELLSVETITNSLIFGSIIQDIISIPISISLFILSVIFINKPNVKLLIVMLGLTAYLFYGYGLYAIQGQYTSLYLIYLAIFGLTLYSLILGIIKLVTNETTVELPKSLRNSISIFIAVILFVLVPVWIVKMIPDIARRMPSDIYGVFVLDLSIIFPALAIIGIKVMKCSRTGFLLAGIALVKIFTLCLSVALGEWLKPFFGFPQDSAMILVFSVLTIVSAFIGCLYFTKLKINKAKLF